MTAQEQIQIQSFAYKTEAKAQKHVGRAYVIALVLAGCLYGLTAQRGVGWQDSGYHQLRALRRDLINPMGLANSHPLMILAAQPIKWLLGPANLPAAMTLASSLGMAIAVANVLLLGYRLTGRMLAAALAAAMLAVCHTAWWLATITETYCWIAAGLTTELLLLISLIKNPRPWKLVLLLLINGLSVSLHNLALLALPVYAVTAVLLVVRRRLSVWVLPAGVAVWLLGTSIILALIVRQAQVDGWGQAISSALFGCMWKSNVFSLRLNVLGSGLCCALLNWPFLSLLPVLLGWWLMPKKAGKAIAVALGAVAAIHVAFALRYEVSDQFMFFLPAYTLFALGAAVGIDRFLSLPRAARRVAVTLIIGSLVMTPVLYGLTPWVLARSGHPFRNWHLPNRDEGRYWITPWKFNETSAQTFCQDALRTAAPDGVIVALGVMSFPLKAAQTAEGLAPGVTIETNEEPTLGLLSLRQDVFLDDPTRVAEILHGRRLFIVAPGTFRPFLGEHMGQCPKVACGPLMELKLPGTKADRVEEKD
jgi:hypothetical protein